MGGAASTFLENNGPKTTVAQELDELGGYDRPALAKNQSFTARLDWLGAKRRQLMAVRRGQGDYLLNAQYAEFYLKQKQYERPVLTNSPSILRNSAATNAAADAAIAAVSVPAEPGSPRTEGQRRSLEHVSTLQRIYSNRNGGPGSASINGSAGAKLLPEAGGAASSGGGDGGTRDEAPPSPTPAPAAPKSPIPGSRWRQTVQHAKKTAFLAVGSVLAMNGKRRGGPNRIDNFALYAEQQLGDGMHKFIEESERDSPRTLPDGSAVTPDEYRVGTMAQRLGTTRKAIIPVRAAAKAQLKALREAESANVLRQAQLVQAIEENTAILQTAAGLLNMYCNRANGRWVELQQWALPHVHEVAMPAVRRQAERYKELVLKDLKAGKLAVQIHVDDDLFHSSRLGTMQMWSADPWQLLAMTHPARAEWTAHLVGLGLGVRQLLALSTAVEAAAGPEAVAKMIVVIACHEGQVEAVIRDVSARKLCRFDPENLFIIVQQRTPGHVYDRARRTFVPTPEAPPRPSGSGYAMLALNWMGDDVFRLGGPEFTQRMPVDKSIMSLFAERDVQWLSSWRLRDLVHFSPESCLNLDQLAVSYALADSLDANISMQVDLVESMMGVNRSGAGYRSVLSAGARAGGIGSEGGPLPTCDVKWSDVNTPVLAAGLQDLLDDMKAQLGSMPRLAVSIKRYAYHVPSLKGNAGSPPGAAAGASSSGANSAAAARKGRGSSSSGVPGRAGSGNVGKEVSNASVAMAAAQAAAAMMLRGRLLTNDSDLDTLAWAVSEQDAHPGFRAVVSATNTARSRVTAHAPGGGAASTTGPTTTGANRPPQNVIVVAVTDDPASTLAVRTAMAIMKPGADCLHVLTIAKDISATAQAVARNVAERYESMASATLGDVRSIVQVKQKSIVEDILEYIESVRAMLVITGSMSLAAVQTSVVGSVALSLARDCTRPILVVKSNARLAESVYEVGKKPCLRALLAAEPTGRTFVRFVVGHVLDGTRGDKLVLLRGRAFDKQMNELTSSRRILDHLADEAASNRRFDVSLVVRRMVPGSFDSEHQRVADADQCHIVGVQ
ncbi:hypothetical protein GPECTOR_46g284 [Gonium pectorale]|uniref:UspA domain-containing protein n=1 Tax=Gonium pectorale TaxID=33097 RepID=A0A150G9H7_GONPE|nr:hypothetical protein GPECTOR_46g284 [Gonium pectorale]|eukprot:KXZ46215.1 hypothetical protein GPECTOR_46g284 [Gonium pectorale]